MQTEVTNAQASSRFKKRKERSIAIERFIHVMKKRITLTNLDDILRELSDTFIDATEQYPDYKMAVVQSKAELDQEYSSLYIQYKSEKISDSSKNKRTEAHIKALIEQTDSWKDLLIAYYKNLSNYEEVKHLKEVFREKMAAIDMLVKLYGHQYWTIPSNEKAD